ncbi:MAG TPA: metal ABC transporter ATP-binding protein [Acidimicrobiia bacterium]|nr:metal ABC transporter ATP-binding protein [Acidimicrobiia bacterium]
MPTAALTAVDLTLTYGSAVAVRDADFVVPRGHTIAVIGPNGSGKSTLLRATAGLMPPAGGRLEVPALGQRGGVALVLQTTDVDPGLPLTVRDVVRMARYPRVGLFRRFRPADRNRVADAIERLELTELIGRQMHELSGGQRQRVLVAQGLAQGAELLLLDEPIAGIDVVTRQLILEVIDAERIAGRTVVVTTHDFDDARRCDAVLLLATKQIAFGSPTEVLQPGPLGEAFGGRMLRLADGSLLVDDPHHHH